MVFQFAVKLHTCKIPLTSITMGKTKELPQQMRARVVDLHKSVNGLKKNTYAGFFKKIPLSTVRSITKHLTGHVTRTGVLSTQWGGWWRRGKSIIRTIIGILSCGQMMSKSNLWSCTQHVWWPYIQRKVPGTQCTILEWISDAFGPFCGWFSEHLLWRLMVSEILLNTRIFQPKPGFESYWKPVVWIIMISPHAQT